MKIIFVYGVTYNDTHLHKDGTEAICLLLLWSLENKLTTHEENLLPCQNAETLAVI
jgi:hypothetical protein